MMSFRFLDTRGARAGAYRPVRVVDAAHTYAAAHGSGATCSWRGVCCGRSISARRSILAGAIHLGPFWYYRLRDCRHSGAPSTAPSWPRRAGFPADSAGISAGQELHSRRAGLLGGGSGRAVMGTYEWMLPLHPICHRYWCWPSCCVVCATGASMSGAISGMAICFSLAVHASGQSGLRLGRRIFVALRAQHER